MFTGIIASRGRILSLVKKAEGARIRVETALDLSDVTLGDSIAVNGVCLTAIVLDGDQFEAELSDETLKKTTLHTLRAGSRVNLEMALRVGDRLGGHIVQGHVDGVARFVGRMPSGDGWEMTWAVPEHLLPEIVLKGSITFDGVSLTVARLEDPHITVAVIPHTTEVTTLGTMAPGDPVNIETDILGKYVRRLVGDRARTGGITLDKLRDLGFA